MDYHEARQSCHDLLYSSPLLALLVPAGVQLAGFQACVSSAGCNITTEAFSPQEAQLRTSHREWACDWCQ